MIKKLIALLGVSFALIFFFPYAEQLISWLLEAYQRVTTLLSEVFAGGQLGNHAREFIAILVIPAIAGLIPIIFYSLWRRQLFPYFMDVVWFVWLIQAGALLASHTTL